eukprot:14857752-Alexandrium_andersonii.AAC.1
MAPSHLRTPIKPPFSSSDPESARADGAECTHRELQGPISRPLLGPRSSNSERLKRCFIVRSLCVCAQMG